MTAILSKGRALRGLVAILVLLSSVAVVAPVSAQAGTNTTTNTTGTTSTPARVSEALNPGNNTSAQAPLQGANKSYAEKLMSLTPDGARYWIENNPDQTEKLVAALEKRGVENALQKLKEHPEQTLEPFLGGEDPDKDNGGLLDFSVKEDVIQPTMDSLKKMMGDAIHWILKQALEVVVGTPVPTDGDGGIVFIPTNDPWASLYHNFFVPYVFPLAAVIALLGMLIECGLMPWRALRNPTYDQSRAFVGFAITLIAIIFTMPIISIMHLFVDILATNVAPTAAELTQSTKGMFKLSAGAILGVVVAYGVGLTEVLLLGLVYALRYGALFYIPWFLPLLIALAYNAPHQRLSNLASHLLWQYIGLLITVVPVAFLLRIAYEAEWDAGLSGLMGFFASGVAFIIAIGLPIITSIGLFKAAPSVQSVAAGTAGYVAGSRATDYARQAPGEAARGGYGAMVSMKTRIEERLTAQKNTPERGQSSIYDFEDKEYPRSYPPEQGDL